MSEPALVDSTDRRSPLLRYLLVALAGLLVVLMLGLGGAAIYALCRQAKQTEFDPVYQNQPADTLLPIQPTTKPQPPVPDPLVPRTGRPGD